MEKKHPKKKKMKIIKAKKRKVVIDQEG